MPSDFSSLKMCPMCFNMKFHVDVIKFLNTIKFHYDISPFQPISVVSTCPGVPYIDFNRARDEQIPKNIVEQDDLVKFKF